MNDFGHFADALVAAGAGGITAVLVAAFLIGGVGVGLLAVAALATPVLWGTALRRGTHR